jgi:hypothetical protein
MTPLSLQDLAKALAPDDEIKPDHAFLKKVFQAKLYCPTRWAGLLIAADAMLNVFPALLMLKRKLINDSKGAWGPPLEECEGGDGPKDPSPLEDELIALDPKGQECGDFSRATKEKHTPLLSPTIGVTYTNYMSTAVMHGMVGHLCVHPKPVSCLLTRLAHTAAHNLHDVDNTGANCIPAGGAQDGQAVRRVPERYDKGHPHHPQRLCLTC